ncbi:MAG: hypothetical protein ACRD4S_10175 [Candidatus Acidiferrales bacterium]
MNLILTLAVLGSMIFAGIEIMPAYFANYQLQDSMESEARFANSYPRKDTDEIRDDIWRKVQSLGVPAKIDDIHVTGNGGIWEISIDYSVPIDLRVYQFNLDFHPHADNKSI